MDLAGNLSLAPPLHLVGAPFALFPSGSAGLVHVFCYTLSPSSQQKDYTLSFGFLAGSWDFKGGGSSSR
jgi:hypothetical protein